MKVKELLSDESKWIKGQYESNGRFCLVGAVFHCYPKDYCKIQEKIRLYLRKYAHFKGGITSYNDSYKREFKSIKKLINNLDI